MGRVAHKKAVKIESYVKKLLKRERPKSIINLYHKMIWRGWKLRERKKEASHKNNSLTCVYFVNTRKSIGDAFDLFW